MRFEWNPEKAQSNLLKHGISFELATRVWNDPHLAIRYDHTTDGEERWLAVGTVEEFTLLLSSTSIAARSSASSAPAGPPPENDIVMSSKPFSPEELEQLTRLAAMSDDDIDTSDIPEMTDEQWNDPRRPSYMGARTEAVTLRIDGSVAGWLKAHASGEPLEAQVNRVLRQYVQAQTRRAG